MKAIDTNIVVRFLTGEEHPQTGIARKLVAEQDVFVPVTVLLESAWVLKSVYGFDRKTVVAALQAFGGLASVTLESSSSVAEALNRAAAGMDIADALHLGAASECKSFLTFDRRFIRSADGSPVQVHEP